VGKDDYQMGWRDQAELYRSDDRQVIESGLSKLLLEETLTTPDGAIISILTNKIPLRSVNGEISGVLGTYQDITERKRAADTIREDEAKFRSLVEQNIAGIFIIREDGTIGYVNPFFAGVLGYAPSDMIEHPLFEFVPEDAQSDAREKLGAQLAGNLGLAQQNSIMRTKDGRTVEVLVNASRSIFEGHPVSLAVIVDVTERKRAERELASTAAILATEHDISPDGIVAVDLRRSIISFNGRFVEMWGIPPEIMASKSEEQAFAWSMQNRIADPAAATAQMEEALAHPEERGQHEVVLTDGRVFEIHRSPMTQPDGGNMGRVWFFRDISARKVAERTLLRLNRTLRTLSRGNEVLVRTTSEPELLSAMCQVIVEVGGYRMAWVGMAEQDAAKSITPVAWAGEAGDYLKKAQISWADGPRGGGPTGRAIRSGEPTCSLDIRADPGMAPWREEARKRGFASSIALPLKDRSGVFAALTLYSAEVNAFDPEELKLLRELANNLAFGIRSLREHAAHEALNQRWQTSLEATVGAIANTVEMRDPYTSGHQQRVARLAVAMAREMGLPEQQIQGLYLAGIIHDVGKIDIPSEILNKPGKLSKLQFQLIQMHAQAGYDIVKGVDFPWPIAEMVRQHHERADGSGYPQGLKAEAILPEAKILAVADVVEAMMSHRPYRAALGVEAALAEIETGKGKIYDTAAVETCVALFRENQFSFE
jgi:PAS domain S-box-containing protein